MKGIRVLPAILCLLVLTNFSGCGSSGVTTAGGGVGGTGISQGPITAFGSVFVNGVEFSTKGTTIMKNGTPSTQSDLGLGMIVTVQGTFDSDGIHGSANQIDFNDILEGPIQSISILSTNPLTGTLVVMGQTVELNKGTTYYPTNLDPQNDILQSGNVIEVSGLIQANGTILATYIELKSTSCSPGEFEVKGIISNLGATTFQINNLTVNYSSATLPSGGLSNGMFVEVKTTTCYNGGDMIASEVEVQDSGLSGDEGSKMELEGFVTQFNSITDFVVNGQHVSTTDATVYDPFPKNSSDLANNVRVEVEGQLSNGILIADKISFDD